MNSKNANKSMTESRSVVAWVWEEGEDWERQEIEITVRHKETLG